MAVSVAKCETAGGKRRFPRDATVKFLARQIRPLRRGVCAHWIVGIALLLSSFAAQAQEAVVVIANDAVAELQLDRATLRAIFSMKYRTWPDGSRIRVYVLRDEDPTHVTFSKKILGVFPHNLRRLWDRQVYSGTGQAPVQVDSEQQMRKLISETQYAIGYARNLSGDDRVKVITVK